GREWQLGYDKLPPLPWWLVELVYRMVGHDVAYYALAQIAVVLAFAIVWLTARELVGAVGALVAVLILDGLHYFHFTAAKFNHDVIQLPLWAFAGYAFHAALRRRRMVHWLLLGITLGLALWAKYFVVVLAAPLALFLLFDRDARPALATPGPFVALAMWGYPLWLFLGLWIVLSARTAIEPTRLRRVAGVWAGVFALFAIVFTASYSVLPAIDHRYRAVFYPGDRLGDELARRFRAAT